jgi:hypothetical protein
MQKKNYPTKKKTRYNKTCKKSKKYTASWARQEIGKSERSYEGS